MEDLSDWITRMDPEEALDEISKGLKVLFPLLDEDARTRFFVELTGESHGDKVSSMVHL
jgi:hypothetical protein